MRTSPYRGLAARRALAHADRVLYLNPDLGRWVPGGEFFPYANVDPRAIEPAPWSDRESWSSRTPPPTARSRARATWWTP